MSKELKPYEKENKILHKIREKKQHQHRRRIEVNAIERGLTRLTATYEHEKEAYIEDLNCRAKSIDQVEQQIQELTEELKKVFPKPKPKVVKPVVNGIVVCEHCGKEFAKRGIKSHTKACLKKQELDRLRDEINKLEVEEPPEEPKIDLDKMTEDVSFIEIEEEEGD